MTVRDLREQLAHLPDNAEVCRHDGEYGAQDIDGAQLVYTCSGRRWYRWTYDTAEEAREMCDEGETVESLVLLR